MESKFPGGRRCERRRRRRSPKSRLKPTGEALESPPDQGKCIARSATKGKETILRLDIPPDSEIDEKTLASPRPSINSTIAFILGGNDDISDTGSDWDEVNAGEEASASDCPLDFSVTPLLKELFSGSVRSRPTRISNEVYCVGLGAASSPHVDDANDRWNREYDTDQQAQHRISKVLHPFIHVPFQKAEPNLYALRHF